MRCIRLLLLLVILFFGHQGMSQLMIVEGSSMNMTPQELVETWLVGQGISVSNCTFNGSTDTISSNQIGVFTASGGAASELGLRSGVLITSGQASLAIGPNLDSAAGANLGLPGDPDLYLLADTTTNDAAVLEFDFIPQYDTLKFRYVFGSEEFFEYCNSLFNDAFGFFLSGPGINGTFSNNSENIATMPGGSSLPVTINNLCNDLDSRWSNYGGWNFQYDGFSFVFTAWHVVAPCSTYHIKLAVADALDDAYDSGVFLEKNSFNATGLTINNTYAIPSLGNKAIEGCNQAIISFVTPEPLSSDYTVHYTIGGTATRILDYTDIPDSLVIPAGSDSAAIVINPLVDGLAEGIETCILYIQQPSCSGSNIFYDTVFIYDPVPIVLTPENDTTICEGDTARLSVSATGGEPPLAYQWNVTPGDTATISVSPPVGSNLYYVVVTDVCYAQVTDTAIVTVLPLPEFTNTDLRDILCPGDSTGFVFQSNVPATFSWTAVNPGGNISGYFPGTGPDIIQQLQNNTIFTDSVLYTVTPASSLCTGGDTVFTAVVLPLPDISANNTIPALCSGQRDSILLSSALSGTVFTWTSSCPSPAVSGYTNGTGTLIRDTLYNAGNTSDTVTYACFASANGCDGPVLQTTVIVHPIPSLTSASLSSNSCSGSPLSISLTSDVTGALFTWTSPPVAGVTGNRNNTVPSLLISDTLFNSTWVNQTVIYQVMPHANGCNGPVKNDTVIVFPVPDLSTTPLSDTVCNLAGVAVTLTSNVNPGTAFTWTCTCGPDILGCSGNATPSTLLSFLLENTGMVQETAVYHIIPGYSFDGLTCYGPETDYSVTVSPTAHMLFTPDADTICSGGFTNINLSSDVAGASFSWTASPPGAVSGQTGGSGGVIAQQLFNSLLVPGNATYTVTPRAYNCDGQPDDVTATVNPVPAVTFTPCFDLVVSINAQPVVLKGAIPYGGTYSGNGVAAGVFYPNIAGAGTHRIYYDYPNAWSCTGRDSATITVANLSATPFICGSNLTDVRDNQSYATVNLGGRCWFAQNLNYGNTIASTLMQLDNCAPEKYCFGDNAANCVSLGGMYQWDEMMQYTAVNGAQGFCPPEWHVATEADWQALMAVYTGPGMAGSPLKYSGFSGFDAFLSGMRFNNVLWDFNNFAVMFWTSGSHGDRKAWAHGMNTYNPSVSLYPSHRNNAFFVRCVRD